jgi:hypothetical protein
LLKFKPFIEQLTKKIEAQLKKLKKEEGSNPVSGITISALENPYLVEK